MPHPSIPTRTAEAMGQRSAVGFAWMTGATLVSKVVNLFGQVVLAWLLVPEDFGLVGLAYTVSMLAGLVRTGGLREVLIYRHAQIRRWTNAAFWISLVTGLLSGCVMMIGAPVAVWAYGDPRITGLIAVLACAAPINALATVPQAKLQSEMRFKLLSSIGFARVLLSVVLSVLFAWLGMGAYSFVLPFPILSVWGLVVLWIPAKPVIRWKLDLHLWRRLLAKSTVLLGAELMLTLTYQGDYALIGLFHSPMAVGLYFFAFNLSTQTTRLLALNVAGILMPALSKLQHEPKRRLNAFIRATRMLAVVAVPLCMLQCAIADPAIRLLFSPKWYPAIGILQILSLGMIVHIIVLPSDSAIKAQGKFRLIFYLGAGYAGVFLVAVGVAAWLGGLLSVAITVGVCQAGLGLVRAHIAIRTMNGTWRDLARILTGPILAGTTALVFTLTAATLLRPTFGHPGAQLAIILLGFGPLYLMLARWWAPRAYAELVDQIRLVIRSKRSNVSREV